MKVFSIFPAGEKFRLHRPDHQVVECVSFHEAATVAREYVKRMHLMWWTDWTTVKPIGGRVRYQRNAIVTPCKN
ncbi:MAG: hypothetical protein Q8N51_16335 [Gammaproteobacteria bacterium]|nr:hypothetical protein [Gammaproteobacteria bacterium]